MVNPKSIADIFGYSDMGYLNTKIGESLFLTPEMHMNKEYEGKYTDLFACAIVIFILVTRQAPFQLARSNDSMFKLLIDKKFDEYWSAFPTLSYEFKNLMQ